MRLAVLTVSPKIEYRGDCSPISPVVNGPELSPIFSIVALPSGLNSLRASEIKDASEENTALPETRCQGTQLDTLRVASGNRAAGTAYLFAAVSILTASRTQS
eukprot:938152-Rhodomonas_salina.2